METSKPVPLQEPDHYHEMELPMEVDVDGIKKAYKQMVLLRHPDKLPGGSSDAKFKRVCVLSHDIEQRADDFE